MACTSTNTQHLIDLLETMFGNMDLEDIDISELELEATKGLHQGAAKVKEASVAKEHGLIPADKITQVSITSIPIPTEFSIPPESIPEMENIKERSTKNPAKKVTCFYYTCCICGHSAQNKPSMMTHTRKCLSIKLVCVICSKEYDSADYAEKHIKMYMIGNVHSVSLKWKP